MVHTNLNKAICLFCNEMSLAQSTIKLLKKINQIKLITASKVSRLKIMEEVAGKGSLSTCYPNSL